MRGNSVLTDVDASIRRGTVQATRNAGKVVGPQLSKSLVIYYIFFYWLGSRTSDHEKCRDRCGCVMGFEGWSSSAKKCKEGE